MICARTFISSSSVTHSNVLYRTFKIIMAAIPVIIGVGDIRNRSTAVADAKEPAALMLEAIQLALQDTAASTFEIQAAIDSIDVVKTWTWPYPDLPALLAQKLGVDKSVKWKRYSDHGGDKPGKLFDEAAKRIAKGECEVAIVTGGEALASRAYQPDHKFSSSYSKGNVSA